MGKVVHMTDFVPPTVFLRSKMLALRLSDTGEEEVLSPPGLGLGGGEEPVPGVNILQKSENSSDTLF